MTIENQEIKSKEERNRKLTSRFEILTSANMPNGINRYRIVNYENGKSDIIGNFFECVYGKINFELANGKFIKDYGIGEKGENKLALIMPLPFANENGTEGLIVSNGIRTGELVNYWGDNALIWFKNGKTGIIKVVIGSNSKSKTKENSGNIKAYLPEEQKLVDEILTKGNGYVVCQQISILYNGISPGFVGQTKETQEKGRRYRFFVETSKGTFGVIDFKEEITINEAIEIMKKNGIKKAVYADIISYKMFFGDKDGNFYTREEGNQGETEYKKSEQINIPLPNKNSIIIRGE